MELSLTTLVYLFFRLSPFILVSYFSLSSIFNQDVKGLIYLAGLLMTCFIAILLQNMVPQANTSAANAVCNLITIGDGMAPFSKIPLGNVMLTYTLGYFVYIIVTYKLVLQNLPTLIIFPMLIFGDAAWNMYNNCFYWTGILAAIIIGGGMGALWAYIIDTIKNPDLLFLNIGSNKSVCSRPSKQLYKCTFKK